MVLKEHQAMITAAADDPQSTPLRIFSAAAAAKALCLRKAKPSTMTMTNGKRPYSTFNVIKVKTSPFFNMVLVKNTKKTIP